MATIVNERAEKTVKIKQSTYDRIQPVVQSFTGLKMKPHIADFVTLAVEEKLDRMTAEVAERKNVKQVS